MAKRSSTWDSILAQFQPFIKAQGEVLYAYNLLHDTFFNVLYIALALERPDDVHMSPEFYSYVLEVWHVRPNDRLQREFALAALAKLPTSLDIRDGIKRLDWAVKQTEKLVQYRNLIAHSPVSWVPQQKNGSLEMVPRIGGVGMNPTHNERLDLIGNFRFWKSLRNDFLNLNDFVEWTYRHIAGRFYEQRHGPIVGARRTWPGKPRLPCVRRIKLIERALQKTKQPPKRRARRKPSRASP